MTAKVLIAGILLAISGERCAWLAMASKRPTAQALLPESISPTSSMRSLLVVMLCVLFWASMELLMASSLPMATRPGSRNARQMTWAGLLITVPSAVVRLIALLSDAF